MSDKKTALITGATGAIGKAIALGIAEKGFNTILAVRDRDKAESLVGEIKKITGNSDVHYELVDLARKKEIEKLAEKINCPIHVLINNAATASIPRIETPEGIEMQWAVNVLGYFWMIRNFIPLLHKSGNARVVNVASYWAGGLNLGDPEFKARNYDNDLAYRQSKQADRMLTYAYAEKLKEKNITVNACHPGDVNSKLSNDLGFGGIESPVQGASTPIWLATEKEGAEHSGGYFVKQRISTCEFSTNKQEIENLFELCQKY